jgi:transposase
VDTEKIAVAVAEPGLGGEVRSLGTIPHTEDSVRRLVKKLGPASRLRVCYEAGPHGYGLYWLLSGLGVHCDVVAPTLVPVKSGDRVKTNRRDARSWSFFATSRARTGSVWGSFCCAVAFARWEG